jgi:hypothetical protein
MWTQIVGKVKLTRAPRLAHWWHIALHLTARGLTTGPLPDGERTFQIDFDFIDHRLIIATSGGRREDMKLASRPLPDFYEKFMARLAALRIDIRIWPVPVEVSEAIPFTEDEGHSAYRPEVAEQLWRILLVANSALRGACGGFVGKLSPVHFFWGSFDLAVTRFSGRRAPEHPGGVPNLADRVTREAYSHEVASAGFWPGTAGGYERPAFYAYAYPEPPGFSAAQISPAEAVYNGALREFLLPYDELRRLPDPAAAVRDFVETSYRAAADLGKWPREEIERRAT